MVDLHQKFTEELKTYFPHLELILGLPKMSQLFDDKLPKLVIMDDLMRQIFNNSQMLDLFTTLSRHNSISLVFSTQNYFDTGSSKTIVRQCNSKVIFDNTMDKVLTRNIGSELVPRQPDFLNNCFDSLRHYFEDEKFPYIVVDGQSHKHMKNLLFRSRIFPNEHDKINPICFFPNPNYVKIKK